MPVLVVGPEPIKSAQQLSDGHYNVRGACATAPGFGLAIPYVTDAPGRVFASWDFLAVDRSVQGKCLLLLIRC